MAGKKMSRSHIIFSVIALMAVLVVMGFLFRGLFFKQTQIPSALLNKPAKDFQVAWLQGKEHLGQDPGETVNLDDFKGKPVVVNFWASWCVSCRDEARDLEKFWQTKQNKDVMVVGIAIQDTEEAAKAFAQHYGKTYILALDQDGRAGIDYGVTGVPETFIIDRTGKIVHKEAGPVTTDMLQKLTATL